MHQRETTHDRTNELRFRLSISAAQYLDYYTGAIQWVQVTSLDGRVVRFPARAIRPFLNHNGISGDFVLRTDKNNRMLDLRRIR